MRTKVQSIELFIDSLVSGAITVPGADEQFQNGIRHALTEWMKLRITSPNADNFSQLTETIFDNLLCGRIYGWFQGRFDDKELEKKIDLLEAEVKKLTGERDQKEINVWQN